MTLVNALVALVQVIQTILLAALTVCFALVGFLCLAMFAAWRKR